MLHWMIASETFLHSQGMWSDTKGSGRGLCLHRHTVITRVTEKEVMAVNSNVSVTESTAIIEQSLASESDKGTNTQTLK